MVWEVLEAALTYNATRWRPNVLTLRFEEIPRGFDGAMGRLFDFLDSGPQRPRLLKAAAQFDLARNAPGDAAHVSSDGEKAPLRAHLAADALLTPLLRSARALLGYADDGAERAPPPRQRPSAELLCAQAKALCRTTDVRFFQWCTAGRVRRGQIPSMPECRDDG